MIASALVVTLSLGGAGVPEYGQTTEHVLAEGVRLFTTTPYGDAGLCGNSVAVEAPDGTLLFDSGGTPGTARAILGKLKAAGVAPVRWLVNSHWHWDHWAGNQEVVAAYPRVAILAQRKTLEQMRAVEPRWNKHALSRDLPGYLGRLEARLGELRGSDPARAAALEARLVAGRAFLEEKRSVKATYPNMVFPERLTFWMGRREVQVFHAPGVTLGDAAMYLPGERLLITGDVLRDPYPYAAGGTYPKRWLATLEAMAALDPKVVVPGHGPAQQGTAVLRRTITLFRQVLAEVEKSKSSGAGVDATVQALSARAGEFAAPLGLREPRELDDLRGGFLETFIRRAHRELDGDLGDVPDGLPE